jgi:aspartokinase
VDGSIQQTPIYVKGEELDRISYDEMLEMAALALGPADKGRRVCKEP